MKNQILSLILCLAFVVLAFASCGGGKSSGGATDAATDPATASAAGNGTAPATVPGTAPATEAKETVTIYAAGKVPTIIQSSVMTTTSARDMMVTLRGTLKTRTGATPTIGADKVEKTGVEIVFGQTNRAITERAAALLPEQSGDEAAYAIYFDADGVAVVWNHRYGSECAVKFFSEEYFGGDELTVAVGTQKVVRFSISGYEEELRLAAEERARREEEERLARVERLWQARFDGITDPEVRAAVKDFYEEFYDPEKIIRWWAGLYDPDLGGFYYSNSARDNEGFLPDMESTLQIVQRLRAFDSSGDLARYLGPDITAKMIKFYQDMQDPDDGYFYHPQWTKAQSRQNVMRYTRDQDWAIAVLNWLGAKPLYPTALDRAKGSAGVYSATVERLASKAKPIAGAGSAPRVGLDWQPNETSVKQYVNNLLNTTSCEHWGNQLDTQISSFEAAGVIGYVLDVLDERVNPDYGLWVSGYNESTQRYTNLAGNSETPYGICTNTYKIMKVYNAGGRLFAHSTKMVENTIKAIKLRDPGARVTYIFNPWATLGQVNTNLKNYGTAQKRDQYDELISENFLEMIDSLKSTLVCYRCDDGSYGFLQSGSSPTIYSTPVSLGTKEGDVNANNLVISFSQHICNTIGLESTIPVFNENHGKLMKELLDNAPSIEKDRGQTLTVEYDFESDSIGSTPNKTSDSGASGTTFKVKADPTDAENKVVEINKNTEAQVSGGTLTVPTLTVPKMDDDSVLEVSMRINVSSETRFGNECNRSNMNMMQIRFMSDSDAFWMPTLRFNQEETGYVFVVGKSTQNNTIESPDDQERVFQFDTWYEFTFRLTIKNYGKNNAEFNVEILVDGERFGDSVCFYCDGQETIGGGNIRFKTGKEVKIRFAPQMRIHALIYVDDLNVTYTDK